MQPRTGSRPQLVTRVNPEYPPEAARNRQTGEVYLHFSIRPDGSPADIEIASSFPPGVFDAAAKEALAQWHYCPAVQASSTRAGTRP